MLIDPIGLPPAFASSDDALQWATSMVVDVETARGLCNTALPHEGSRSVRDQQRAERAYLMKHGAALGALGALLRCEVISTIAYHQLTDRVRATLTATTSGSV